MPKVVAMAGWAVLLACQALSASAARLGSMITSRLRFLFFMGPILGAEITCDNASTIVTI